MSAHTNLLRIKTVHDALGSLSDEVVFVSGPTVSLYAERAEEIRPTDDVDILLEIWTYNDYTAVEDKLRKLGFTNDQFSRVICRYTIQGITVDIMPTGENVIGFSLRFCQAHILLQQNSKPLKTGEKMTDAQAPILKISFLYWKIDLRFGKN